MAASVSILSAASRIENCLSHLGSEAIAAHERAPARQEKTPRFDKLIVVTENKFFELQSDIYFS
jgi:hypothetical protein